MSSKSKNVSRRDFLVDSSKAAAGLAAVAALSSYSGPSIASSTTSTGFGANEQINMAVMGVRQRGRNHLSEFAKIPNVKIKAICDIDEKILGNRADEIEKKYGERPITEVDIRKVLENKDIDAIAIAAPDHWHALATIWACQAGKHVYVEKPCSHTIWEGRKMIEAARKYKRIVAVGFQNRSIKNVQQAIQFLHDGGIGEVYMAKGLCYKPRGSIGKVSNEPVPKGVHYDLWLGCAPDRPFNKNHFHYEWHWNWTYGAGDIGNQGPHQFDVARWGLNKSEHPVKISSSGGYYAYDSDQETPNTQVANLQYADGKQLCFEVRGLYTNDEDGIIIGNLFYGTKGWMHLNGSTWKTYFGRKNKPGPGSTTVEKAADPSNLAGAGGSAHFVNFITALRSGKYQDLTCDIEEGHISTALPHLANIAYRVGHSLVFDGATEKFKGDKKANKLLTKQYRKPFVIPEKV